MWLTSCSAAGFVADAAGSGPAASCDVVVLVHALLDGRGRIFRAMTILDGAAATNTDVREIETFNLDLTAEDVNPRGRNMSADQPHNQYQEKTVKTGGKTNDSGGGVLYL